MTASSTGMIQLISLLSLITVMQACLPGTGTDTAKMTIDFEVPYTESNRKHYENLVKEALNKIASQYHRLKYNSGGVTVTSRSVDGKLLVDVLVVNVACKYKEIFEVKFKSHIGDHPFNVTCPAQ
ncbi:hypothetical protein Y032_0031g2379 [Ancylostoma ceylanicum]|nr:hypothetical protein Y032_0031g2379 [Ancylostoma ceylanicum]